jgi:hypothetical protein
MPANPPPEIAKRLSVSKLFFNTVLLRTSLPVPRAASPTLTHPRSTSWLSSCGQRSDSYSLLLLSINKKTVAPAGAKISTGCEILCRRQVKVSPVVPSGSCENGTARSEKKFAPICNESNSVSPETNLTCTVGEGITSAAGDVRPTAKINPSPANAATTNRNKHLMEPPSPARISKRNQR